MRDPCGPSALMLTAVQACMLPSCRNRRAGNIVLSTAQSWLCAGTGSNRKWLSPPLCPQCTEGRSTRSWPRPALSQAYAQKGDRRHARADLLLLFERQFQRPPPEANALVLMEHLGAHPCPLRLLLHLRTRTMRRQRCPYAHAVHASTCCRTKGLVLVSKVADGQPMDHSVAGPWSVPASAALCCGRTLECVCQCCLVLVATPGLITQLPHIFAVQRLPPLA